MHSICDTAARLTNQMQNVIAFLEMDQPGKALEAARSSVVTLHLLSTTIAAGAAEVDAVAAELHQLTEELARKNRPRPKPQH